MKYLMCTKIFTNTFSCCMPNKIRKNPQAGNLFHFGLIADCKKDILHAALYLVDDFCDLDPVQKQAAQEGCG